MVVVRDAAYRGCESSGDFGEARDATVAFGRRARGPRGTLRSGFVRARVGIRFAGHPGDRRVAADRGGDIDVSPRRSLPDGRGRRKNGREGLYRRSPVGGMEARGGHLRVCNRLTRRRRELGLTLRCQRESLRGTPDAAPRRSHGGEGRTPRQAPDTRRPLRRWAAASETECLAHRVDDDAFGPRRRRRWTTQP